MTGYQTIDSGEAARELARLLNGDERTRPIVVGTIPAGRETPWTAATLWIGAGRNLKMRPGDLVGAIANEAGLDSSHIGSIQIADNFYADVKAQLKLNENSPMRLTAVEEGLKNTNARMERITDLIQSGQDAVRRDMQNGFDLIRKDVSGLSTDVKVLGSKLEDQAAKTDRTRFNMPILKR